MYTWIMAAYTHLRFPYCRLIGPTLNPRLLKHAALKLISRYSSSAANTLYGRVLPPEYNCTHRISLTTRSRNIYIPRQSVSLFFSFILSSPHSSKSSRRQLSMASHANVNQDGEDQLPLPQHEILGRLRRGEELSHRRYIWWLALGPCARIEFHQQHMTLDNLLDCCNKAAPVYLLEGATDLGPTRFPGNMFQYIYRRWFVPYKRNLEYNQYLVTFLRTRGVPEWVQAKPRRFLNQIVDLNASICAKVKKTQLELVGGKPDDVLDLIRRTSRYRYRFDMDMLATPPERLARARLEQEFLCLQPLFRAMAIVVCGRDVRPEDADIRHFQTRMDRIGQTQVLFICTGVEERLSAPITFDSVAHEIHSFVGGPPGTNIRAAKMSLETAISLTLELESREVAAFGARPDPARYSVEQGRPDLYVPYDMILDRGRELAGGHFELAGPSSSWVDPEMHTQCTGDAAERDRLIAYFPQEEWPGWPH